MSLVGWERTEKLLLGAVPRVPFLWIGPAIFLFELIAILTISVVSGVAYHEWAIGVPGDLQFFVGVGAASFLYYALVFSYRGNYSIAKITSGEKQAGEITTVWAIVVFVVLALAFLLKIGPNFSRGSTVAFFGLSWLFLIVWRWCLARWARRAFAAGVFSARKAIVVADSEILRHPALMPNLVQCGYRPVKVITVDGPLGASAVEDLQRASRDNHDISDVLLALNWQESEQIDRIVQQLSVIPLPIVLVPDVNVSRFLVRPLVRFGASWMPELQRGPLTVQERVFKRAMDLLLATVGGILISPLLLIVAVLIKLDSRGPVLFTQARGGFNGRSFRIFKFRTLTAAEDGPDVQQVLIGDHRITRIGHFLRDTRIDEFPQLLNVLRGEMSLVGPRPHAAAHNSYYEQVIADYSFRHHVKPGLTGWAQVNGYCGEIDVERMQLRVSCDRWYIDNWSLWLDIKIIARTTVTLIATLARWILNR